MKVKTFSQMAGPLRRFHAPFEAMKYLLPLLIWSASCAPNSTLKATTNTPLQAPEGSLNSAKGPDTTPLGALSEPPHVGAPTRINAPFLNKDLNVDTWTKRFEGESREVYRARLDIVAALDLREGQVVVDLGAGSGLFVAYLAKAVGDQGQVIAIDISQAFVTHIQRRAQRAGLTNVRAHLGTQDDIRLDEASVDFIFTCDTYHHFEDPPAILATMRRALKPEGRLAVVDYHRIEGKTRPFLMKHVRAPKEVFEAEIRAAGFTPLPAPETPFLEENYLMLFER